MSDRSPSLVVLEEIRDLLRQIRDRLPPPPPRTATDAELDGPYGDPIVKFQPRSIAVEDEDVKGKRLSELSVLALAALADAYDGFAARNDDANAKDTKGRPKSTWDRQNAALCRGWIARIQRHRSAAVRRAEPRPTRSVEAPPGAGDAWEPSDEPAATGTDDSDDYE